MIGTKNNFVSLSALIVILLVVVLYPFFTSFPNPFTWDSFGYYLYLPLTYIHNDLGIQDYAVIEQLQERQFVSSTIYQIYKTDSGNWLIRYPAGLAILLSPFYLIGHVFATIFGLETDGFSRPYQIALVMGALFYISLGYFFLRRILLNWFSDKIVAVTLLLLFFGTNLIHQNTGSPTMSHSLLFFLYTVIILLTISWHKEPKISTSIILGITIGLIVICRPTEIIAAVIPLFWGVTSFHAGWVKIKTVLSRHKSLILTIALCCLSVIFIQMLYWKMYVGHFVYNSYNNIGEGLDLKSPHIINSLFSFRKGWFIYTPLMLFAIIGFIHLNRTKQGLFFPIIIFFGLNVYLVSSWTNWWYATSYGHRAYVQSYVVLSIPLACFLNYVVEQKVLLKTILTALIIGVSTLSAFQYWQYRSGILPMDGMTFEYYKSIFGKIQFDRAGHKKLLLFDRNLSFEQALSIYDYTPKILIENDFEKTTVNTSAISFSGSKSLLLSADNVFSEDNRIEFRQITDKDYILLEVSFWAYITDSNTNIYLVNTMFRDDKNYGYVANNFIEKDNDLHLNEWKQYTLHYIPPHVRFPTDYLQTYFWFVGGAPVYIDDLKVTAYIPFKN
jgi:hypothetical protein